MKEKLDKTIIVLLSMLLIASTIFIDEVSKYYVYVKISGYVLLIIYILIRFIQKEPIKIIKNKLDIMVFLLIGSTIIPIMVNSYITLGGAVQEALQYIYIGMIYLIVREIVEKKDKVRRIISNLFIILTVMIIIIGIDGITSNYLDCILGKIKMLNGENRLISVFGYSNVLAAYIASVVFLNLKECLKQKKQEIKAIYKMTTMIFMIGILLTYSKAVLAILPVVLLLYIGMQKDKNRKIEMAQTILISFIMSILFLIAFEKIASTGNYLLMWIVFAIMIMSCYLLYLVIEKLNSKNKKILNKKSIIVIIMCIFSFIVYIVIGLNIYDEYEVFNSSVESNYEAKVINHIQGNKEYVFEFKIEAKAPRDIENTYTINIIERDGKNQETNQTEINFGTFQGIKTIKVTTKESTQEVKIEFKSKYPYGNKKLIVESFFINQKETALKYKYLPTKLVEKVQNIDIRYKTAQERFEMINNAIELIKENFPMGIGGKGWQYKYQEVQNYPYIAQKLHSYPAKIILEFGVLGILAYVGIAVYIIKMLIKQIKIQNMDTVAILFAVLLIVIHSMIDTDMEYSCMLIYIFTMLGILSSEMKNQKKTNVMDKIANIVLIIIAIINIGLTIHTKVYNKYDIIDDLLRKRNGLPNYSQEYKELNSQIAKKYEEVIQYEKYNHLQVYNNIVTYYLNSNYENKLEVIEKYYEIISKSKKDYLKTEDMINRLENIYSIIDKLDKQEGSEYGEITEKFIKLLLEEYEDIKDLQDERIDSIYQRINKIKSKYLLGAKIMNESGISIDEQELEKIEVEEAKEILLYHTHGTESYKTDREYTTYDFYKSLDENYNVIKVGNYLGELLRGKGMTAIHNKTYHNYPSKTDTYAKSRETVKKILEENKNINKIIDIHRNAYSDKEHEASTIEIKGEKVAKVELVIGINQEDKDWMYDLKWAIEIQKLANKKYPGLCEPILIREEEYNQDLSKYAILVEVGENCNQIEQALNAVKYFSEVIK